MIQSIEDARTLQRLGIPISIDVRGTSGKPSLTISSAIYGRSYPVPCTLCNNYLKWPLLKKISDEWEFITSLQDIMYAGAFINGYYHITTGADPDKDQSFFPMKAATRNPATCFSYGQLTKARVREIAAERGFLKSRP